MVVSGHASNKPQPDKCYCVCGHCFGCDGEGVEGGNMSNDCTLNQSQNSWFYYVLLRFILLVYLYICYVELSNCPFFVRVEFE